MEPIQEVFVAEASEQIDRLSNLLVDFEVQPEDTELLEQLLRTAHNLKGGAGTAGHRGIANVVHALEDVVQLIRGGALEVEQELFNSLFAALDALREALDDIESVGGDETHLRETEQDLRAWLSPSRASSPEPAGQMCADGFPVPPLGEYDEVRIRALRKRGHRIYRLSLELQPALEDPSAAARKLVRALRQGGDVVLTAPPDTHWDQLAEDRRLTVLFGGGAPPEATLEALAADTLARHHVAPWTAGAPLPNAPDAACGRQSSKRSARHSVRVGVKAVDGLVDLIGELVIVESMLVNTSQEEELSIQRLLGHLNELTRITRELQDTGMGLRMVPLRGTFRAMGRMVRDIAQTYQRSVRLVIDGGDTEIDRSMVERLQDPLVHLIRNAVDHGIEPAAERRAAGKPEQGTVTLSARQQGGSILIEVADDGRGLHRKTILHKAQQAGLLNDGNHLTDTEVFSLLLESGFSTVETVTEISGRGIGLDVVRRNVELMRGSLTVDSQPGAGTVFRLKLPITLAIIDGMLIASGHEHYILPTRSILESVQPSPEMLFTQGGAVELLHIRGEVIPLIHLSRVFDIPRARQSPTEALVVIVESGSSRVGIIVDDVVAQQQVVIKSIGRGIPDSRFLSGAAILPDGQVGLILNVDELVKLEGAQERRRALLEATTSDPGAQPSVPC